MTRLLPLAVCTALLALSVTCGGKSGSGGGLLSPALAATSIHAVRSEEQHCHADPEHNEAHTPSLRRPWM